MYTDEAANILSSTVCKAEAIALALQKKQRYPMLGKASSVLLHVSQHHACLKNYHEPNLKFVAGFEPAKTIGNLPFANPSCECRKTRLCGKTAQAYFTAEPLVPLYLYTYNTEPFYSFYHTGKFFIVHGKKVANLKNCQ